MINHPSVEQLIVQAQYGYNYWVAILLMVIGLYIVIASSNLIKKLIGLALFQVSVFLLYISSAYTPGCKAPVLLPQESLVIYCHPLPHVLMLTAIVVGVSVMAVGLAIVVRLKELYGTIEEGEMLHLDELTARREDPYGME